MSVFFRNYSDAYYLFIEHNTVCGVVLLNVSKIVLGSSNYFGF